MEGILGRIIATLLGLLALAAVVFIGQQALAGNKVTQTVSDLAQVATNARNGFSTNPNLYANFSNANSAALISAGVFPTDMVSGGTTIVDAWGNSVTFGPTGTNNSEFQIQFGGGNMSADQCAKTATGMQGYVSLSVGGTNFTSAAPPDLASAGTACSANTQITAVYQ